MTAPPVAPSPRPNRRSSIVAMVWSACSITVAATWLVGLPQTFPLVDEQGQFRLGPTATSRFSWLIILLSALAVAAASSGFGLRSRIRPGPLTMAGLAAGVIAAALQAGTLPLALVGMIATGRLPNPFGLTWQLITVTALVAFARLVRLEWRAIRGRCLACGAQHPCPARPVLERPAPTRAPATVCVVSVICLAAALPWAAVKLGWGFGATVLGVTATEWRRSADATTMSPLARALSDLGLDITVLAAGVGMLLSALLLARLPRWLPGSLLAIPSVLAAFPLASYGYPLLIAGLFGLVGLTQPAPDPAMPDLNLPVIMIFGGLTFAGIGTALAVGAVSLLRRSRAVCRPGSSLPR